MKKEHKIIYFDLNKLNKNDMIWGVLELGLDLDRAQTAVPDAEYGEEILTEARAAIGDHDLVLSQDFSAVLAQACHELKRVYISWVYDCPQRSLYMKEALYDSNMIFVFDRHQLSDMKKAGLKNIWYEPLAANVTYASTLNISDEDEKRFSGDVSFVGNMYREPGRGELLRSLPDDSRKEYEKRLEDCFCLWNKREGLYADFSEKAHKDIMDRVSKTNMELYSFDELFVIHNLITTRELAYRERIKVLNSLAERMDVRLYTNGPEKCTELKRVKLYPPVDYATDMYKVFHCSRINLNITLPSIETGVPLRVFDIMSVGGFVLSNYQAEIPELFENDREIVTYSDIYELRDKARWYLDHDRERMKIAIAGYERVKRDYSCPVAMKHMFDRYEEVFGA